MSAHTPGPWIAKTESGRMFFIDASIGGRRWQEVATCLPCEVGDIEANARLIAAAPQLLEALMGCVDALIVGATRERDRALAAIAAAKGTP